MRVIVDFDQCESNGLCVSAAPEVFLLDDNDELQILIEQPDQSLREKVAEAARNCPKQAITIEEG